jgi:hypothetical protein
LILNSILSKSSEYLLNLTNDMAKMNLSRKGIFFSVYIIVTILSQCTDPYETWGDLDDTSKGHLYIRDESSVFRVWAFEDGTHVINKQSNKDVDIGSGEINAAFDPGDYTVIVPYSGSDGNICVCEGTCSTDIKIEKGKTITLVLVGGKCSCPYFTGPVLETRTE